MSMKKKKISVIIVLISVSILIGAGIYYEKKQQKEYQENVKNFRQNITEMEKRILSYNPLETIPGFSFAIGNRLSYKKFQEGLNDDEEKHMHHVLVSCDELDDIDPRDSAVSVDDLHNHDRFLSYNAKKLKSADKVIASNAQILLWEVRNRTKRVCELSRDVGSYVNYANSLHAECEKELKKGQYASCELYESKEKDYKEAEKLLHQEKQRLKDSKLKLQSLLGYIGNRQ